LLGNKNLWEENCKERDMLFWENEGMLLFLKGVKERNTREQY
jgi:hypothetical protein